MNQDNQPPDTFTLLQQATLVLLAFQAVFMLARLFNDSDYSSSMTAILAATLILSVVNQRLAAQSQGAHAAAYITLWRFGALTLLAALTTLVAVRTYLPDAVPDGAPTLLGMLVAAVIALKGAALGKLKPNRVLGLRLRWTCQSRLAWEQAHRLMGRILFFGGLAVLAAAPFTPPVAILLGLAALVLVSVTAGAIRSRNVWRSDPERQVAC